MSITAWLLRTVEPGVRRLVFAYKNEPRLLRLLAARYADQPGYDEKWRP